MCDGDDNDGPRPQLAVQEREECVTFAVIYCICHTATVYPIPIKKVVVTLWYTTGPGTY